MCPEVLQVHLQLNSTRLVDYTAIRQEIVSYIEARNQQSASSTTPMDVGSLLSKGTSRDAKCFNCGKLVILVKDCWTKPGGAKGSKSGGKGKGKSKGGLRSFEEEGETPAVEPEQEVGGVDWEACSFWSD